MNLAQEAREKFSVDERNDIKADTIHMRFNHSKPE
jgi:hypothetical protein